jgi:hypothetical protein
LNKKILTKKVEFFKDDEAVYWSVFISTASAEKGGGSIFNRDDG